MSAPTPMTPLEQLENEACAKIATDVADQHRTQPYDYDRGATLVADVIAARIRDRQVRRGVEPDPFARCLYRGCDEEALGAFCTGHTAYLSRETVLLLASAIANNEIEDYGRFVKRAREEIDKRTTT